MLGRRIECGRSRRQQCCLRSDADPVWFERSSLALAQAADTARLSTNPIKYGEVSIHYKRIEDLEEALSGLIFVPLLFESLLRGKHYKSI
jgi:hypothetical protein